MYLAHPESCDSSTRPTTASGGLLESVVGTDFNAVMTFGKNSSRTRLAMHEPDSLAHSVHTSECAKLSATLRLRPLQEEFFRKSQTVNNVERHGEE